MTLSLRPTRPDMLRLIGAGLGYFTLASLAMLLTRFDGGVSCIWVASAFLIAMLAVTPRARWHWLFIGAAIGSAVSTAAFGLGPKAILPLVPLNMLEAGLATWLLRRRLGNSSYFDSPQAIIWFALIAGAATPALTGLGAAASVHMIFGNGFGATWLNWYAGHALGSIAFTPLFLFLISGGLRDSLMRRKGDRRIEAAILFGAVAIVTYTAFAQEHRPTLFIPLLPMMIATMRLGRVGAAGSVAILTIISATLTLSGHGPLQLLDVGTRERAQFFQFYIACASLLVLPVSALLNQREDLMRRLSQSEARYRLMAQHNADAVLNLTIDGTILYASPAVRTLAGLSPEGIVGRKAAELIYEDDIGRVRAAHREALAHPGIPQTVAYRIATADGALRWFETTTSAVIDEDGQIAGAISAIRDISERKANEQRLTEAATRDPLTGLLNRGAFMAMLDERMEQVRAGRGIGAVALFDLDHFKSVNDGHGHAAGDAVLRAFASTASAMVREGDSIGRIGGEEFALILWNADPAQAFAACERLREAIGRMIVPIDGTTTLIVTSSAGIAPIDGAATVPDVLASADRALYAAKAAGRNRLLAA